MALSNVLMAEWSWSKWEGTNEDRHGLLRRIELVGRASVSKLGVFAIFPQNNALVEALIVSSRIPDRLPYLRLEHHFCTS